MLAEPDCPHCGTRMDPIRTPIDSSWGGETHYICFNDTCSYFVGSWDALEKQGVDKTGYRCRMDPRGACGPAPVWSEDALKDLIVSDDGRTPGSLDYFSDAELSRDDETEDGEFYSRPRFVDHLDKKALETVAEIYGRLAPPHSRVLDLMAGPESHLTAIREPEVIMALGLNEEELKANKEISGYVITDINMNPELPFPDEQFDVVVNTVSVDYLTRPVEVFREVARVLNPGGLFIVVFSNRMFPPKAVNIWRAASERQRVELVRKYFALSRAFSIEGYYESKGKPRPADDKYAHLGIPSDPVYAVWGKALTCCVQ